MSRLIHNRDERKEYWHDELVRRGFSLRHIHGDWSHYGHGVFTVSFNVGSLFSQLVGPYGIDLSIMVPPTEVKGWVNTASVSVMDVEDSQVDHVLDCLVEPELLPTCVGIGWFGRLLENWLAAR